MKSLFALLASCLLGACTSQPPAPASGWTFAVMGDTPYSDREAEQLVPMIGHMNRERLAFVVHVGDILNGRGGCSDAVFESRRAMFAAIAHPFILLPGDNDWTDCHRGGFDPMERLERFRTLFSAGPDSLGRTRLRLERQSDLDPRHRAYREHVRWQKNGVVFIGLNVPGSNNNLGRTAIMDGEHRQRMAAVFDWIEDAVKLAARPEAAALVVMLQANPDFERKWKRPAGVPDGFESLRNALAARALRLGKPLLFVHGDTHSYQLDRPLTDPATGRPVANFLRLEVDGSPRVGWSEVNVDPAKPALFTVRRMSSSDAPVTPEREPVPNRPAAT